MAMARAAMRLAPRLLRPGARSEQQLLVRRYADVLKEEERAKETMYIKRMEQERAEKLAKQRAQQEHGKEEPQRHPDGTPKTEEEIQATKTKGIAMAAGVVALASCVYWYATSSKKKVVDEE